MPTITFLPDNATLPVEAGTSILDAAAAAGVTIVAPCGGEGACGLCRVKIESGAVERVSRGCLSSEEVGEGFALACSSRVVADVTIRVLEAEDAEGRIEVGEGASSAGVAQIGAASTGVAAASVKPTGPVLAREPLARKLFITVEEPSRENSFSDLDRLTMAIRAAGGPEMVRCGLGWLQKLAHLLRSNGHRVTITLIETEDGCEGEIVRLEAGDTTGRAFGLAIDIGTTTCAIHLVDLARGRITATGADYNAQIARGLDIISRINYAKQPERLDELRRMVLGKLNDIVDGLCADHAVAAAEISNAVVVGNTTMIHLLLGLDPEYIRLDPYTPTLNRPPLLKGREVGLRMNPEGYVLIAPGVGSYVGGDITAGLLVSALAADGALAGESDVVRLFLDIGTNGEVVCGNGEWLMACAASAGPAFEGSGVSCGVRASKGAIERVRIDPASGRALITVIGGGRARGVCGSGMIDLLAELWEAGMLDPSGKLDPAKGLGVIRPAGGGSERKLAYVIVPAAESETGEDIVLDEHDIQNLLRTKAAIYSACALMLKQVGLDFGAVAQVYVAGGFGRFLDLEKSIAIGMLPDLPLGRYTYLGNSALGGALAMLTSAAARRKARELADRITYLELNTAPDYMDEYMAALFLPHTDMKRFPTVAERIGKI